jgi:hypothetical protein
MWISINNELINLELVTHISKSKGHIKDVVLNKKSIVIISITGKATFKEFDSEQERDKAFDEITVKIKDYIKL